MCNRIKDAYGRSQVFSKRHKHLPHCRLERKPPQLYRSTHNLHLCHMSMSPSHSCHNMALDPPVGTSISHLKCWILVYHIITGNFNLLTQNAFHLYLAMAVFECLFLYDATLYFCPCLTIGGLKARIKVWFCIRAGAWHFPAIDKLHYICGLQTALSGEVIFPIPIEIST